MAMSIYIYTCFFFSLEYPSIPHHLDPTHHSTSILNIPSSMKPLLINYLSRLVQYFFLSSHILLCTSFFLSSHILQSFFLSSHYYFLRHILLCTTCTTLYYSLATLSPVFFNIFKFGRLDMFLTTVFPKTWQIQCYCSPRLLLILPYSFSLYLKSFNSFPDKMITSLENSIIFILSCLQCIILTLIQINAQYIFVKKI